jgi:hypothetical protein
MSDSAALRRRIALLLRAVVLAMASLLARRRLARF